MFPTRNGTGVLFIPAYIDHGSTSGQSNGTSRCYVMLDDEQEVEEEEVDQQPPNRPPSHSEALQHVHSLMQFAQTNLPHLQPTLINTYSEIERNWATANIQKKKQTTFNRRNRQYYINFLPLQNDAKKCCSCRSVVM